MYVNIVLRAEIEHQGSDKQSQIISIISVCFGNQEKTK